MLISLVILSWLSSVISEVTILKSVQTLYDRSPKLRIKGSGFDVDEHSIILEIGARGATPLKMDKDFLLTKDDDGLILKLLSGRRWVNLDDRDPPVALILSAVKFESNPDKNLLADEIIIANVLATPTVEESKKTIYQTATNEVRINGTGFMGAKKVDLFFSPPLFVEVGYEIVSPFPLTKEQVVLRLRHNYKWREEPGPLMILGVDTGAGPVKLNGDDGILVGNVEEDLELHNIYVESTATEQLIYHDEAKIFIKGKGFNPQGTTLRFANGLLGKSVNYTTKSTTSELMLLSLVPTSGWRKNVENLPGYLTLLAVNAGEGFVAVGPTNSAKGKDIATVFERPNVFSSNTKLFKTHSHELHIAGVGFTSTLSTTQLVFEPALKEGTDYSITINDRTDLVVTLLDGKSWSANPGPLIVKAINTRGDEDGWVNVGGSNGVHVAEVVDDVAPETTGGIEVFPMGVKVYQSAKQTAIAVTGSGFKDGISLGLEPDLKEGVDYDLSIASKNSINLILRSGKKWRSEPGFILAKTVKVNGKTFNLGGSDGIRIATVLADPVITAGKESFHETQSKVIAISGHGFTNVADTKVVIRPTLPGAYKILAVLEDTIRVQLKPGSDWLPTFVTLKDDDTKKIPLQITSIDSGAGEISFDSPITIGFVVKDREGVVCDDSCEFAFDGVCDDGSEAEYDDDQYGYKDDDLGGYYADNEDGNGDGEEDEGGDAGYNYDDYYSENDEYKVSACVEGTDCTDCGGVDAIVDYNQLVNDPDSGVEACTNTCPYARDGVCDDPRGANYCKLGSDCQDCGPVGADNFTKADDDGWWDDDDDYWTFNDGNFLDQTGGLQKNWDKVKRAPKTDSVGAAAMFLVILEGMVYTVGAIFAAAALYLGMRYYKGQSMPCVNVFDSELSAKDLELAPTKRMPITPDVIRT